MRISVTRGDPGQVRYAKMKSRGNEARITLDGVEQRRVLTADEELGLVIRIASDETGKVLLDREGPLVESQNGVVRIEEIPRAEHQLSLKRRSFASGGLVRVGTPTGDTTTPLKVGDQVVLNSGGPMMLVVDVESDAPTVATSDGAEYQLPRAALTLVSRGNA